MLIKDARTKRYPQKILLKMQSKLKISKLKTQSNYSIYQKFNEKIAEFQKTI